MKREKCLADENIVRAIRTSDWDEKNNRWSSSLFINQATSVSRTKKLSLTEIQRIFCKELHKPPAHKVIKTGEITVGKLASIGLAHTENKKPKKIDLWVEKAPTIDNPAHAEVFAGGDRKKLPRSLAKKIIGQLKVKKALPCSVLNSWLLGRFVVFVSDCMSGSNKKIEEIAP